MSLNPKKIRYKLYIEENNSRTILENSYDQVDRLWLATFTSDQGKKECVLINDKIIAPELNVTLYEGSRILRMGEHKANQFWIGKMDGLEMGEIRDDGKFVHKSTYLKGNSVSDVFWDLEGGCWISTLNNGVYYSDNFAIYHSSFENGLLSNNVVNMTEFQNEIWTAYSQGYQNINQRNKVPISLPHSYTNVSSNSKKLVISSTQMNKLVEQNEQIHVPFTADFYIHKDTIYSVNSRVFVYNDKSNQRDTLYDYFADSTTSRQTGFSAIAVSPEGDIILGNIHGLFKINDEGLLDRHLKQSSQNYGVSDILFSDDWGLIVATRNNGIFIYENEKLVQSFNTSTGLISNKVSCVAVNESGVLYIGTNAGISVLKSKNSEMELISKNQGLTSPEVNALLPTHDYLYVGTKKGLYKIDYSILKSNTTKIKRSVYLDAVLVDDKKIKIANNLIHLPYGKNSLRIRFRTTNYKNWHNKKYQYRLSENDTWIEVNTPDIVILRPQGNYQLEVRYLNESNVWSVPFSLVDIQINLPFWKRWYFWTFIVIIFFTVLFLWYRNRQVKIERNLRIENEMLSLEQRMQNARMNPHFIFNVLNSIHSCLLFNENDLAGEYLLKFSGMMREVLKSSGESALRIEDEINILSKYVELEQLRHDNLFQFHIGTNDVDKSLLIPSMVVQPFVENAILHGVSNNKNRKGEIHLDFKMKHSDVVEISIQDNGEHFSIDPEEWLNGDDSHAIGITRERLESYNKMYKKKLFGIEVKRINGTDPKTTILLTVPIVIQNK
ncbi:MAG: histidine kinase [Crocinitomicaceae bacterium]|nr:histidine kinase [Crocinitomicaceae bacterium]